MAAKAVPKRSVHQAAWLVVALPFLLAALSACSVPEKAVAPAADVLESLDPPAGLGAFAPNLASADGNLIATWLEPAILADDSEGHRLRFSRFVDVEWSEPVSIAEGSDFFANWADFPAAVESADGTLWAHWLAKTAPDTYAYSIFLARSADGGSTWEPTGKLNSDDTATEHGFVTFVREARGVRAFWLDGRAMVDKQPMALRTAILRQPSSPSPSEAVLDARVCECCGTDSVMTDEGPVVVYRDRSETEVRDISIVRRLDDGWSAPQTVHGDLWEIAGCPVNGPAIAARDDRLAVAWFTGGADAPRVQVAFSEDSGESFGDPLVVDSDSVLGRVDIALDDDGSAWVSWVGQPAEAAQIYLQSVAPDGQRGERQLVAETSAARASGFPILEQLDNELFMAWVEVGEERSDSRVRIAELPKLR